MVFYPLEVRILSQCGQEESLVGSDSIPKRIKKGFLLFCFGQTDWVSLKIFMKKLLVIQTKSFYLHTDIKYERKGCFSTRKMSESQ